MRAFLCALLFASVALAQAPSRIALPKPETKGGKPLMEALAERHSARDYSAQALPPQTLSNLLWAADGVNRADGRRTAPSAMNRQSVEVYVVLESGAYVYDAKAHALNGVATGDLRALTGTQPFAAKAALNLVYVVDTTKNAGDTALLYGGAETGFIAQNVYLYCASAGLNTVVRASVDRDALAKALHLRADQRITLAQSVGYAPVK